MDPRVEREFAIISATSEPATRASLAADLAALGVERGGLVMVHSSLSSLGWVVGGAQTAVLALTDAVGRDGTLVMPSHSTTFTEPGNWRNPPVPEKWWPTIRSEWPPFDPAVTPSVLMGAIAECFRTFPGAVRSNHPRVSFSARGPAAAALTDSHALEFGLGEGSPLARLYDMGGQVLLAGVGHSNNTMLHLAEFRSDYPNKDFIEQGSAVFVDGRRQWVTSPELEGDTDDFETIGHAFELTGTTAIGKLGSGVGRLMDGVELVDFASAWMTKHR